ncbi:MAG: cytochrome c oxidase subunit II transmembrane domain-containing protein, partial [Hyphomicrobiaceae bacterium]
MAKITMPSWLKSTAGVVAFGSSVLGSGRALAAYGQPEDYALGFQEPVTEVASYIQWFHDGVLTPIIVVISLFVLVLLVVVVMKFSEKANPEPSKNAHHTGLEVAWT